MRISLEWLKEYVDISGLMPEEIANALTNSGLEVESIEYVGPKFSGVIVAQVLALAPHPNADKLRLVTVDLGEGRETQVVCGAPNVREGIRIAFAQEGAVVLNRKDGTTFTLGRAKIRGVESAGMVCSIEELGLEARFEKTEDGIWPLDALVSSVPLGCDLKQALGLEADVILEVSPTANRGDLMSVIGVAREVAALFDRVLHRPEWVHPPLPGEKVALNVHLQEPAVCRYYGGVLMRNLQIGPSPDWMSRRLQAAGVRSISNVVDITNYVMLETGQPLHAFDLDKLSAAGKIGVRHAQPGESLQTLDDVARSLTSESVVVTYNDQPVALAGVMGGAETEIDAQSQKLLLESAYFDPAAIRKSAKSVGLRSEASARFERGVDIENCRNALFRATELLEKYAAAQFIHLVESPVPVVEHPRITLSFQRIEKVLGLSIDPETVAKILKKLGFRLQSTKEATGLVVEVPAFRQEDVSREIDLIEEVIRIYGYDKVPYTLPMKTGTSTQSLRARILGFLSESLRSQGLQEVVTTSLVGQSLLEKTGFSVEDSQLVTVLNSHSADHTLMRQSLLPNLLEVAKFNQAQGLEDVWIYELGRTYFKLGQANHKNSGVSEKLHVAALVTGTALQGDWHRKETADFYVLKGVLENLLAGLQIESALQFAPTDALSYLHPGKAALMQLNNGTQSAKTLGVLGELHPLIQKKLKFRQPVYLFELNVELLYKTVKQLARQASPVTLSQYPSVKRDMAFLAAETIEHQTIAEALQQANEPLLRQVELFDEYRSAQLGAGQRSLAYRLTFQSDEGTMTDADVDARFARLKEALALKLPIQFR